MRDVYITPQDKDAKMAFLQKAIDALCKCIYEVYPSQLLDLILKVKVGLSLNAKYHGH